MISVLVCSVDRAKFAAVQEIYRAAMGAEPWELIGVHDAASLAEGYTRAIAASHGEMVVLSHDDMEIFSGDLPGKLKRHLRRFDLIGVAGTSKLVGGGWSLAGPPHLFGQILHRTPQGRMLVDFFCAPRRAVGNIQALDGVFMAARRSVFEKIAFDAKTFDGFHGYDIDFSYQAYVAGMKLGVACDINLLHHSIGSFDDRWKIYERRFVEKWVDRLPATTRPRHQFAGIYVDSVQHALEVMNPRYWDA